jgi:protein TonB
MKFITFLFLSLTIGFSPNLMAQQSTAEIQKEADKIKSKEGKISFDYAESLLELAKAYQKEKNFEKAATLDQEVTFILKTFSDSIPEDYEIEFAIQGQLEELLLEQYFTRWQGLMGQEKYAVAQELMVDKDWIERSIKTKQYLDVINLFQVAHQTISSQNKAYLKNWETAYNLYTSVTYYNLQQTSNLWKAITLHRAKETKEESPEHLEVLFGYASFCDRTNDTETYEQLKTKIEKHWANAFGNAPVSVEESPAKAIEEDKTPPTPSGSSDYPAPPPPPPASEESDIYTLVEQMPRFPGCEALEGDNDEKKACADQQLLKFIYTNIAYPNLARENGIEGMSVIRFTVTEHGTIVDLKILRDPGGACGKESLRVVKFMNELPSRWTPGEQSGEKVRVMYNLPVRFKLQ